MFAPSRDPIPLSEASLLGLCASLNAPVLQTDELPSGPARAAIVSYAEAYGDLALAIGVRALESGQVIVFRNREPIADLDELASVFEEALAFAEGLGFLFDDDMIERESGAGRPAALEHWNRLIGPGEVYTAGGVVEPPAPLGGAFTLPGEGIDAPMEDLLAPIEGARGVAAGGDDAALLLDELMDVVSSGSDDNELLLETDPDLGEPSDDEPVPRGPSHTVTVPPAQTAVALSKFRGRGAAPAANPAVERRAASPRPVREPRAEARSAAAAEPARRAVATPSRPKQEPSDDASPAALGRIPLVRRKRETDERKSGLLSRLLASF